MSESVESKPIVEKLLEKTKAGRLHWEESAADDEFRCVLGDYTFYVRRTQDGYGLRMEDAYRRVIIRTHADEEIVFADIEKEATFSLLSDVYELARREALQIPEKLANAAAILDKI